MRIHKKSKQSSGKNIYEYWHRDIPSVCVDKKKKEKRNRYNPLKIRSQYRGDRKKETFWLTGRSQITLGSSFREICLMIVITP